MGSVSFIDQFSVREPNDWWSIKKRMVNMMHSKFMIHFDTMTFPKGLQVTVKTFRYWFEENLNQPFLIAVEIRLDSSQNARELP